MSNKFEQLLIPPTSCGTYGAFFALENHARLQRLYRVPDILADVRAIASLGGVEHNAFQHRAVIVIGGYPHFASQGDKTIGSLPSNLTRRFQRPDSALIRPKGWFGRMRAESAPYELRISSLTLPNPGT